MTEAERLHGFPTNYNWPAFNRKERNVDAQGFVDRRFKLLGNCFAPPIMCVLIGELRWSLGWLRAPLDLHEMVADRVSRLVTSSSFRGPTTSSTQPMLRLLRHLFEFQSSRGNEIRTLSTRSQSRHGWQGLPRDWFIWKDVLSVPWRSRTAINVAEGRARQLALRWRARDASQHSKRHLHLLDSQVTLANAAKRHTGSMRDVPGSTRDLKNPADAASRNHKGWRLYSELARAVEKKVYEE